MLKPRIKVVFSSPDRPSIQVVFQYQRCTRDGLREEQEEEEEKEGYAAFSLTHCSHDPMESLLSYLSKLAPRDSSLYGAADSDSPRPR